MSADPWPEGIGRRLLAEVDSTNAEAARLAASGAGPCWILAGFQTGGRGRRGRPWVSPRGNFHATLLLHPEGPPDRVALLSFAVALALREALAGLTGLPQVFALKWPNDVLLNGGKMAGILLESVGQGRGVAHLAIGIGVNLIAAPDPGAVEPGALRPVSVLEETGLRIAPEALLDALAPALARWQARLETEGFAPLRAEWLAHAARLGEPIRARTGTAERQGIFEGIDAQGALILRTAAGVDTIPAAEVFF
ncbi:biotin--[acetyl-CoA-carboxylase] ligase [Ruixingdingia sedimenti]|uniref:biotin--[biotin carboxyl-carrier protein] ligase n=1 Tax=Ruixingdingia sedimenti TaxID=3073604 RepID=A0ABU1F489_9RHOB|nr:biotin--[acetyl-CoA-carboxylase] ligase [Xinfangfangia sp. LG-4]MDR5651287.1 biotin--[acetyl-CoA-carboxylase] ligase [Xinfangfangia sp. LG-4]